ncbi:hypothetical protein [Nocardia sp. NBC_00511]|uniref:hypothetical protein n=1 Tax=Nocardia sp. NBC_00511 TaxID=2903591 RepID=UPI0030E35A1E
MPDDRLFSHRSEHFTRASEFAAISDRLVGQLHEIGLQLAAARIAFESRTDSDVDAALAGVIDRFGIVVRDSGTSLLALTGEHTVAAIGRVE